MAGFSSGFGRWWRAVFLFHEPSVPYSVECACGAVMTGTRRATSQFRICPVCKHKTFILGRSPLPLPAGMSVASGQSTRTIRIQRVLLPILALAFLCGLGLFIFVRLWPFSESRDTSERRSLADHQEQADKAWDDGDFAVAADEYAKVLQLRASLGDSTSSSDDEETRDLQQRRDQARLVANRLSKPLSDLLAKNWKHVDDDELQTLFAPHRGESVAFDLDILHVEKKPYQYERHVGEPLPRLELDNVKGLDPLPLRDKKRIIFGVKLASLHRDRSRPVDDVEKDLQRFSIGFEPDSFVLITDEPIVKAMHLSLYHDTPSVLKDQRRWLK